MDLNRLIRVVTSPLRAKPNTFIIGAQKGGTSSLHTYLAKHPNVVSAHEKELHFFSGGLKPNIDNYKKGKLWYRSNYPLVTSNNKSVVLDSTPFYSFHPLAAARIKRFDSNAKFIFLLRDPVERAISHYYHTVRHGFEKKSILDALTSEESRLQAALLEENFKELSYRVHSYKTRGLYLDQIKRYLKFFPKEQLLILNSEDFFKDPKATTEKTTQFLDLDFAPLCDIKFESHNVGKNKSDVPEKVRDYLSDYYKEPNKALFEYLGRSFNWQ